MNINEFKAWLDGYQHSFGKTKAPNAAQWAEIAAKIEELTVVKPPVTHASDVLKDEIERQRKEAPWVARYGASPFPVKDGAADVAKMDPTAVGNGAGHAFAQDDAVEQVKRDLNIRGEAQPRKPRSTFHHPV